MTTRSRKIAGAVAAAVTAGTAVVVWSQVSGPGTFQAAPVPPVRMVEASVPEHELLQDALTIVAARREGGQSPFPFLTRTRPPGLTHLQIGGGGDAVVDSYLIHEGDLAVKVAVSALPTTICADLRAEKVHGWCLRDEMLPDSRVDGVDYRHLTVYLTDRLGATPASDAAGLAGALDYWNAVEMVPTDQAFWFSELTDLAERAPTF